VIIAVLFFLYKTSINKIEWFSLQCENEGLIPFIRNADKRAKKTKTPEIVRKGIAYSQHRGEIAFTVPKFDEFMKRAEGR